MKRLEEFTIYSNPDPLLVSRQAIFPGIVQLPGGELLAMFSIGQAFDAAERDGILAQHATPLHDAPPRRLQRWVDVLGSGFGFVHLRSLCQHVHDQADHRVFVRRI